MPLLEPLWSSMLGVQTRGLGSTLIRIFMTSRYFTLVAVLLAFFCTSPLNSQQFSPSSVFVLKPVTETHVSTPSIGWHPTDSRLIPPLSESVVAWIDQPEPVFLALGSSQPRLRWQYPLFGALIGGAAGALYADALGLDAPGVPFHPKLYGAAMGAAAGGVIGAIGAIVDASIRR